MMLKMKLHKIVDRPYKLAMSGILRLSKGYLQTVLYLMPSFLISYGYFELRWRVFLRLGKMIINRILHFHKIFCICFNKGFILYRCVFVHYLIHAIATSLDAMIALAWLCEKMKVNIEITHPNRTIWQHFENNALINTDQNLGQKYEYSKIILKPTLAWYAIFSISSEYGYKVLSKLSIKESLKKSANEWFDKHIKGDWIAVHYRGTDIEAEKSYYKDRYRIELDSYITYLKNVLDEQSIIFACSDQAQFIEKMHEAFPGRVHARAIKRSYDHKPLHMENSPINNLQQEIDGLIDILILAKAKLIYTTGSGFVDIVRYFNPQIKIISLDGRRIGKGKNNIPIPRKDLFNRLCIPK